MVTSEPNSGSVGESPTPVDTVPEPRGGEDPPRPPSVATTEASGMDGTQEEASSILSLSWTLLVRSVTL